ncbi:hypothetical protein [Streptomyces sp. NPDC008001]|uniref:hypothetical protein n=1 Tax=Streptomyces sp. NPDC008001 TaxID=3364804 RepID=UPI0036E1B42D
MPRPTPAQITYGSATIVFSTLAMLLLSQTRSGIGIAVIAVAALALGLFVAVAFPAPRAGSRRPRVPRQHTSLPTESRLSEHSLHG